MVPDEHSLIFMRPSLENSSIIVDVYLSQILQRFRQEV